MPVANGYMKTALKKLFMKLMENNDNASFLCCSCADIKNIFMHYYCTMEEIKYVNAMNFKSADNYDAKFKVVVNN